MVVGQRVHPDFPTGEHRRLEPDAASLSMHQRLVRAAIRIENIGSAAAQPGQPELRVEQARVFCDFATYLTDLATRPACELSPPFCRIIQPPRTGKTVVAGHIIDRTGLTSTFIVPTRTLVDQTVRELGRHVPNVAIGTYCGERKLVVADGINVITYAMLQRHANDLPEEIRASALVFVDEAHHAMTLGRTTILAHQFDPMAVRVALTATPDYDSERRLEHVFPDLIHEITLAEALQLELLAPLRVWVAEVDADASRVRFVAGDFEHEVLGRLMSSAPFFRAVEVFRYDAEHAKVPCLIACASRQQAYDLHQYLARHRPRGRPAPALLLGDSTRDERERVLTRFDAGTIDTLVQVGVLIEGWSSPQCKLLLDLAPSMSRVRATQKYFRVMTRHADHEARIVVLVPKTLPAMPILPVDLFGGLDEYQCGHLIGIPPPGSSVVPLQRAPRTPVAGVELQTRILLTARHDRPALDPTSDRDIRSVIESCPTFDPATCGVYRFAGLHFEHPLFTGRGDFLLRWIKVPGNRDGYHRLLGRIYPEAAATLLLAQTGVRFPDIWCADDLRRFRITFLTPSSDGLVEEPFASTWHALSGARPTLYDTPEAIHLANQQWALVLSLLPRLTRRQRGMLIEAFGLFGLPARTIAQLAASFRVSTGRVGQVVARALGKLRRWAEVAELPYADDAMKDDAARRQAETVAARDRYLADLVERQANVWQVAGRFLAGQSVVDHSEARRRLVELREAVRRHGVLDAFEARLAELRGRTAHRKAFWARWADEGQEAVVNDDRQTVGLE